MKLIVQYKRLREDSGFHHFTFPFMQKISPFLWFDDQAEEAANFYVPLFKNSKILNTARYQGGKDLEEVSGKKEGTVMTVEFELCGQHFTALNGGPVFKFNPSISFAVACETEQEIDELWAKLMAGGTEMMPLQQYPFSKKFGWVQDKYGVSWQLNLTEIPQQVIPYLTFVGGNYGKAEEAMNYYCSIFKNSKVEEIHKAGPGEPDPEGSVSHARFRLEGQNFMIMESAMKEHKFTFNEAISFVVSCDNQEEVDHFWNTLSEGGDPKAQQCGWLKDKYGVSWQIVPTAIMGKLMSGPNGQKVTSAMLKMKKLDIKALEEAAQS